MERSKEQLGPWHHSESASLSWQGLKGARMRRGSRKRETHWKLEWPQYIKPKISPFENINGFSSGRICNSQGHKPQSQPGWTQNSGLFLTSCVTLNNSVTMCALLSFSVKWGYDSITTAHGCVED